LSGKSNNPGRKKGSRFATSLFLFLCAPFACAAEYDIAPAQFLSTAFDDGPPEASLLWLTGERGKTAAAILGHTPASLRVRYWRDGERTAWILEETGKEKLITAGFVVDAGKLADVKVLAFRESRGWEIKHDFFTDQFNGVQLTEKQSLDTPIDNITGATLSVNAMQRMARLALFLDGEVRDAAP
jgi:hypothetical protein